MDNSGDGVKEGVKMGGQWVWLSKDSKGDP